MTKPLITIMIPTLDRPVFIGKLLQYYKDNNYKHKIIIGDSSNDINFSENRHNVISFHMELNVSILYLRRYNDSEAIQAIINAVDTPYAVFSGDDDLLVPSGLDKCVDFLQNNWLIGEFNNDSLARLAYKGYSAAHGKGVLRDLVTLKESPYIQPVIGGETGAERLLEYFSEKCHPVLFSVHPTSVWQRMYSDIGAMTDKAFTEYLPCCISAISGKIAEIDCPYLIRQNHTTRYKPPDFLDWILSRNWNESCKSFLYIISEELVRQDGIGEVEAERVAKQALWNYLAKGLTKKYKSKYCISFKRKIRNILGI